MLTFPPALRVFLCTRHTDLRQGFDRLAALVTGHLELDPLCGHLFVFKNKRADRLKILYWDCSGYCLWYKRLEAGTFAFPESGVAEHGQAGREIRSADLLMLLEGIDPARARRRTRYHRPVS